MFWFQQLAFSYPYRFVAMHIPVIVGMYFSGKQSATEPASDAGVERSLSCPSPKKGTERGYRNMELNALNHLKPVR
jgi:hypothetical protein